MTWLCDDLLSDLFTLGPQDDSTFKISILHRQQVYRDGVYNNNFIIRRNHNLFNIFIYQLGILNALEIIPID